MIFINSNDELCSDNKEELDVIADYIVSITNYTVKTGYYSPDEDIIQNEADEFTGYYYLDVE